MRKVLKRLFAAAIVAVMIVCAAPLSGFSDFVTTAKAADYKVGDTIYFGSYPQREINDEYTKARVLEQPRNPNGTYTLYGTNYYRVDSGSWTRIFEIKPIPWQVLSVESDKIYVLSKYILDGKSFNDTGTDVRWVNSSLRTWLNSYFYDFAFSENEKKSIKKTFLQNGDNPKSGIDGGDNTNDYIFIPSYADVLDQSFGFNNIVYSTDPVNIESKLRRSYETAYAHQYTVSPIDDGHNFYWLRTPGQNANLVKSVGDRSCHTTGLFGHYDYDSFGAYYVDAKVSYKIGVRPAMKLDINSSTYKIKEKSNYSIKVVDGATEKPISGVSVIYDGKSVGTTKSDGTYTLLVGENTDSTKEVKFVKGEYSSSSRRIYELNPYGQNTIAMNSGFDISGVLSDISFSGEKISGPTVNIMGKSFPLFSFDGGLNLGKFSFKYNQDTKKKTVKYIVGIKDGIDVSTDEDFSENYNEFKSFFKGFSSNEANYNNYRKIRSKLNKMEGKIGFDANLSVAGYLEFDYSTGSLKFKEGGMVVTAEAAVSQDVPFWGICYATFKIGGEIEGKLYASQESSGILKMNTSIGLNVKPSIGVGAKLLSKDVASVEVGINGIISGKVKLPADSFKNAFSAYMNANVYVKVKALWLFEHKWSNNFPNLELFPNFGQFQTSSEGGYIEIDEDGNVVTIDEDDLKLIDRSYNDNKPLHTASVENNDYLNDTSVYPYGYPELVRLDDGRVVAFYLYDDGSKSDINRTTLYYSIFNNNQWSVPLPVNNSGFADFPVKVCTDGSKIYVVWQRANEVLQESYEVADIVDKTELVYAEFDGASWSEPVTIDTAGKYQMLYSIAEKDGRVAIEWAENSNNNYTLEDGITTLYYKTLDDGVWSDETTVDSENGIADASIGFAGSDIKVVYSVDADGDLTTANDSEIYVNGSRLTNNEVDEGEISYQNGMFYWIQGTELFNYDGSALIGTGLNVENDYRVLSNGKTTAVTSLVTDGFKNELVVSYLSGNTYTKPVALTNYGKHIGYYDAILNSNGSISVLADVDNLSNDINSYPYTTTDMVCDIISGKTDLGISDVLISDSISVGSTVTFNGTATNNGTAPVDSYSVIIKDSSNNVLVSKSVFDTLLPGESKSFTVDYTLPEEFTKQDVTVSVNVDNDVDTSNDLQKVTVGYADVAVAEATIARDGTITATVVNNGIDAATNVKVNFNHIDGDNNTLLSTFTVGTVNAGETKTVTYTVPASYLSFENSYCVSKFELETVTDSEENSLANNEFEVVYAPIAVEGISLNTSTLSLEYGQTAQLIATVYPSNAFNKGVHFISDSTDVATVDDSGNIITVGNGTAIITAITDDGDYIAQCQVTVSVKVTSVDLDQSNITVNVGNTIKLNADVTPDVASDKSVIWSSSDTSVATVDSDGIVRGVKTGTATITAKTNDGGFEACCTVNVINAVMGITISDQSIALFANKTKQLKASVTPADADNTDIVWESSDDEVATVSSTGLVTAVMPGTAIITVTSIDGGYTASCTVTVGKHVSSIILSDTELTMPAGTTDTLYATVLPLSAFDKTVTWVSTNPKAATVDQNGNVQAVKAGTTTIIAYSEDGDVTATCTVTVTNSATGIEISESEICIARNSKKQLNATVKPDTAENKNITWESKYPEIASVDSNGLVTAKMAGTTIIVATSEDGEFKAYCSVKVVGVEAISTASIDFDTGIITGLSANLTSIDDYVEISDSSCELKYDSLGTDSIVYLTRDDEVIDAYTVVIFGDVNGDGWYDGQDAVTVSMIAGGMLTREQVGEAVWMAADCNHDGVIDQADVDLLNQAGVLLSSVDQTKSTDELIDTSSEYVEYLNLIDQQTDADSDEATEDNMEENEEPTELSVWNIFVNYFVELIKKFLSVIKVF